MFKDSKNQLSNIRIFFLKIEISKKKKKILILYLYNLTDAYTETV